MDIVFEFLLELILEGSIEASQNKNTPKWIRYPLVVLTLLFFISVLFLLLLLGFIVLKKNKYVSFFLFLLFSVFLISFVLKIRKFCKKKKLQRN